MKRFIGWVVLGFRLHASLRAAQRAIGEVGRRPIRVRPARRISVHELGATLQPNIKEAV
jgi:hypothetical protein